MKLFDLLCCLAVISGSLARSRNLGIRSHKPQALEERRFASLARITEDQKHGMQKRAANDTSGFRYYNDNTKANLVESLPEVNYDLGELYSGYMPIQAGNNSRSLFYVFEPTVGEQVDEITIYLNGGPGCSSLVSWFQENGRFTWQPGTMLPVQNQYSWVNLTNMLWVEYPIGVGFTVGAVTADTQEEIAQDFLGFFKNFQDTYNISNYKIYVTGESYSGRYVPYISSAMINANDTKYYDLKGALMYDPVIGSYNYVQQEVPVYPLVERNALLFNLNETFMSTLQQLHQQCGYKDFLDKYLVYPPSGVQPPKYFNYSDPSEVACDLNTLVLYAALAVNPCFDTYEISETCPILWDVLGAPGSIDGIPGEQTIYFNRPDVRQALHIPASVNVTWEECTTNAVFTGGMNGPESEGDLSADPIQKVLPQVIEHTNRVLISNGDLDFVILTNGTLLAIQNMTWNGQLGFQSEPNTTFVVDLPELQYYNAFESYLGVSAGNQGVMGLTHFERGLMWAETFQTGHMQPQYQPRASYRHLQWLLGRIDTL